MTNAIIYIERDGKEIEVSVSGDVTPFRPGRYHGPPELCYPDEGGEVEVTEVFANGKPFELADDEILKAENALVEAAEDIAAERYYENH